MDAVLLDTTVASFLHPKKNTSSQFAWYKPHLQGNVLVLNFQSVAELWAWAVVNEWGRKQRQGLEAFLGKFLIVPYDFELAKIWAEVMAHCRKRGRRLEAGDAWILATAVHRRLPLVTHDADYLDLGISGLRVISALE